MHLKKLLPFLCLAAALSLNCNKTSTTSVGQQPHVLSKDGEFLIVDVTGKRWDVTHAVENYGFDPFAFQFGLGPFAIQPLILPQMIERGEPGYPEVPSPFLILGTDFDNDPRAYPIRVLARHEVADEKFGDTHVAVAY